MEALPSYKLQNLRPYDPEDPSTYASVRPRFLRYQKNRKAYDEDLFENSKKAYDEYFFENSRKAYDEDFFENSEGMFQIQRLLCYKIIFLILVTALFLLIFYVSPSHCSKLYGYRDLHSLNCSLPIGESLGAEELGLLINEEIEEPGFRINEIEVHGLVVLKQLDTLKFERKLALKSPNYMEAGLLEENETGKCILNVFFVEDSKHLGVLDVLVAKYSKYLGLPDVLVKSPNYMEAGLLEENKTGKCILHLFFVKDSKHLGALDEYLGLPDVHVVKDSKHFGELNVLVAKDSKHLGALSNTAIAIMIPILYAVTGVFLCTAALVINWYRRRTIHVKEIKAKNKNSTQQGSLKQLSKMQMNGSPMPTVQLLNEYSIENAISSSDKKKDNIWNDANGGENSFYISNPAVRRKDNSACTTNQENMLSGEIPMKTTTSGSLITTEKKGKNKKQQQVTTVRRSDRIRNPTKSNSSLYKQDVDSQHLKAIPLRRSERIRNSKKSDCACRKHE